MAERLRPFRGFPCWWQIPYPPSACQPRWQRRNSRKAPATRFSFASAGSTAVGSEALSTAIMDCSRKYLTDVGGVAAFLQEQSAEAMVLWQEDEMEVAQPEEPQDFRGQA